MTLREQILMRNPEALLLNEAFDPALIGIVHPIYVHQPDVFVAAYDTHKIDAILWEQMKREYSEEDVDTLADYCAETYWQLLDFGCGNNEQRKHLPVIVEVEANESRTSSGNSDG
jgi:hypothetical protein